MEQEEKTIWIFHHYATPPTMSGLSRPYEFSKVIKKYNYNSVVFSASYMHYSDENIIEDKRLYTVNTETEVPFVFVNTPSSEKGGIYRVNNMFWYFINILKCTNRVIKDYENPKLIIASSPHPLALLAGLKVARKYRVPCICEIRDFWPEVFFLSGKLKETGMLGRILCYGEYWIYKKSDAIIFLKEGDVNYLLDKHWTIKQGGKIDLEKCYYINNGVDIATFNNLSVNCKFSGIEYDAEKFYVTYTGAIRNVNNVGNIIDAAVLLKKYKNIEFIICGDGNQLKDLKNRVYNERLDNVKMVGYVEKKYIPSILCKSSVNILNYSQEKYNWSRGNSSNKMFEYMASGRPIISTVQMGYSPIEKYECGISLESDDGNSLAKGILEIYNMDTDRYKELGRNSKKGAENFDYLILSKRLISVMEKLI